MQYERVYIDTAKKKSIVHYLISKEFDLVFRDKIWICSSLFSRDTTWSFAIYPTNSFYCWSTGRHGDILDLIKYLENLKYITDAANFAINNLSTIPEHDVARDFDAYKADYKKENTVFDYTKFINTRKDEVDAIFRYGASRGITSGFLPGKYYSCSYTSDGVQVFNRHAALMFLHTDLNGNICGAKFRNVDPNDPRRFTARGDLGFYILDTMVPSSFKETKGYLVESETSANSLWRYLTDIRISARIISMGGVGNPPKTLPKDFTDLSQISLLIDFDGNNSLFQQRIKKYEHLKCKPIKMILPKGEDINSLYATGRMYLVETLLLNN